MGLSASSKLACSQEQNLKWHRGVHGCGAIFFDLSRDLKNVVDAGQNELAAKN
jgi:hypothetical protein